MVSTRPLISNSSSSSTNFLVTVPSSLIILTITATFIFHSFFSSPAKSRYLSIFSISFSFTLTERQSPLSFLFIYSFIYFYFYFFFFADYHFTRSGRQTKIMWSVCNSKFHRIFCISFSRTDSGSCIYHSFV